MIGRTCRNISPDEAGDYIRGYTIGNDYGLHDFRDTDSGSMLRVKGADTLCPLGPGLVEGWDFHGKQIRTLVNGEVRQDGNTDEMEWDMHYLVADIARTITLQPGRRAAVGHAGHLPHRLPGDVVEVEVEGLGTLRNHIVDGPDADPHRRRRPADRERGGALDRAGRRLGVPRDPQARPRARPTELREGTVGRPPADHRHPGAVLRERLGAAVPAPRSARAKLVQAVYDAGGEPLVLHPERPRRSRRPTSWTGWSGPASGWPTASCCPAVGTWPLTGLARTTHETQYDVDETQDAFDLALARVAIEDRIPLLAICRGTQVVNVARGGDLVQDMTETLGADHRHLVHEISSFRGLAAASPWCPASR